jgi:hypothetical protein
VIFDSAANTAAYDRLLEALCCGRALAFVGAGVSRPLGYPSWEELVQALATEARRVKGDVVDCNGSALELDEVLAWPDPLVKAQILKDCLEEDYYAFMQNLFKPKKEISENISLIVSLPFRHLITSNYETSLEWHHTLGPASICVYHSAISEFIHSFQYDGYDRRVVHVHGRYDEPKRIILTQRDYDAYQTDRVFERFWAVMSSTATLVFFGFSFTDIDLLYGFIATTRILGTQLRHFAVLGLQNESDESMTRITYQAKYGIEPVCFLQRGKDFSGLTELLARLKLEATAPRIVAGPPDHSRELETYGARYGAAGNRQNTIQQSLDRLRQLTERNIFGPRTGDLDD